VLLRAAYFSAVMTVSHAQQAWQDHLKAIEAIYRLASE
jgi:hypothetical protein